MDSSTAMEPENTYLKVENVRLEKVLEYVNKELKEAKDALACQYEYNAKLRTELNATRLKLTEI